MHMYGVPSKHGPAVLAANQTVFSEKRGQMQLLYLRYCVCRNPRRSTTHLTVSQTRVHSESCEDCPPAAAQFHQRVWPV